MGGFVQSVTKVGRRNISLKGCGAVGDHFLEVVAIHGMNQQANGYVIHQDGGKAFFKHVHSLSREFERFDSTLASINGFDVLESVTPVSRRQI